MKYFYVLIVAIALSTNSTYAESSVAEKLIKTYPYYASKQKSSRIKGNYTKIQKGMTSKQVQQLLGEPDEIRPLSEPNILDPKQIGYTHWYLIQRKTDTGSQNDGDEKLVRVSCDLN